MPFTSANKVKQQQHSIEEALVDESIFQDSSAVVWWYLDTSKASAASVSVRI